MYIKDDKYATYKLLLKEFRKKGYTVIEFTQRGRRHVSFTSKKGKNWTTPVAHILYPMQNKLSNKLALSKSQTYLFAKELGIRVPSTYVVPKHQIVDDAFVSSILSSHDKVIVKPSRASLSKGLTLGVTTNKAIKEAIEYARLFSSTVLVQEQVEGEEVRFIVLNHKVVGVLLRQTPRLIGDGESTIAYLLEVENESRKMIDTKLVKYPQLGPDLIDEKYFSSTKILKKNEVLELNRATMIKNGCSVFNIQDSVHPSYIAMVENIADKADIGFGSIDVFCIDYKAPLSENYWLIEINSAPVLKLCYGVRDGHQLDIAPIVANAIDAKIHSPVKDGHILGIIEHVDMPKLGIYSHEAKVDTGAYSGAIHCSYYKTSKRHDGKEILRFTPLASEEVFETEDFTKTYVTSASGHRSERYIITTQIVIKNVCYDIKIGLSDRKDLQKDILIGRRFLRKHKLLVDVTINQELDSDGGRKL